MDKIILKKEVDRLMKTKGQVIGLGIKNYIKFISDQEGENGLKRLENTISELGYPLKHEKIRSMEFYPLGLEAVILIIIKHLFNYDNDKFQEMGRFQAKSSLIVRMFMKYFVSLDKVIASAPTMWKKWFTVGDIKVVKVDKDKKFAIVRINNFDIHPLVCETRAGYFSAIIQLILGVKGSCKETKCVFRGDKDHEFLLEW